MAPRNIAGFAIGGMGGLLTLNILTGVMFVGSASTADEPSAGRQTAILAIKDP